MMPRFSYKQEWLKNIRDICDFETVSVGANGQLVGDIEEDYKFRMSATSANFLTFYGLYLG